MPPYTPRVLGIGKSVPRSEQWRASVWERHPTRPRLAPEALPSSTRIRQQSETTGSRLANPVRRDRIGEAKSQQQPPSQFTSNFQQLHPIRTLTAAADIKRAAVPQLRIRISYASLFACNPPRKGAKDQVASVPSTALWGGGQHSDLTNAQPSSQTNTQLLPCRLLVFSLCGTDDSWGGLPDTSPHHSGGLVNLGQFWQWVQPGCNQDEDHATCDRGTTPPQYRVIATGTKMAIESSMLTVVSISHQGSTIFKRLTWNEPYSILSAQINKRPRGSFARSHPDNASGPDALPVAQFRPHFAAFPFFTPPLLAAAFLLASIAERIRLEESKKMVNTATEGRNATLHINDTLK
ncbi:hypothetical protein CCHR01_03132 [Colletotrichum chrysophilum]|uniref:Uncharacterized protein n=1 Tax=Colletotrichum chrysophilum TaxID=1836956 RepID=A0AAD9EMS1_9PEZI|nr:hypothetical protein CCHR01_03132 [Colletotrichum chrysophilum]